MPSVADSPLAMNAAVYVKPEVESLPESTARSEVLGSSGSQSTDATTTSIILGGSGVSGASDSCADRDNEDDVRTLTTPTLTSPDADRRTAAIEQRLAEAAAGGGYKYKDNIKRRFCSESEGDTQAPYVDMTTYSSSSDDCPDCSSPPSSPAAPPHSATADDNGVTTPTSSRHRTIVTSAGQRCPGFVLHPSGAYYVPVIVSSAQLRAVLGASSLERQQGPEVICHPVSIPVRFSGSATTAADVVCVNDVASTKAHHPVQCPPLLQLQRL